MERYFHPASHTTNTMVPSSIFRATLRRAGQRRTRRDAGEHARLRHQAAGPLERLAGPHDALAVEQLEAAPLLEHGRDVAVVEAAQALDLLTGRRLDRVAS